MNKRFKTSGLILVLLFAAMAVSASGSQEKEADDVSAASEKQMTIADVASELGVSEEELKNVLGDPSKGAPDFPQVAGTLGVDQVKLEELMKMMGEEESVEVDPYHVSYNGIYFEITFETFTWDELPGDVKYERQPVQSFTSAEGSIHYYEAVYVESGNLNWYQAAFLAEDAGGYLACPGSDEENAFIFALVNDTKYFWAFPEEGVHHGISIGPFLGAYQPEGSVEPAGGWCWLSGEAWEYTNWAQNLDDGVIDKDPRPNDQPNDSGEGQPIMGFGEMNLPVPTWGDYMEDVGTYGLKKSPGNSYGFIIEYESDPS